jgi:cytochrome c-type biogenesis protein CcmH/NrfG
MADPNYEPTDEELRELSREAFAGIGAQDDARLARLREEIKSLARDQPRVVTWRAALPKPLR